MAAMPDLIIPGFTDFHPMGARLAQECVRIDRGRLPVDDLPDPVRRPRVQPVAHATRPTWPPPTDGTASTSSTCRAATPPTVGCSSRRPTCGASAPCLDEYPDALIIQTHRDPVRVISSISALAALLREHVERPQHGGGGSRPVQRGHPPRPRPLGGGPRRRHRPGRPGGRRAVPRVHGRPLRHHRRRLRRPGPRLHRRGRSRHARPSSPLTPGTAAVGAAATPSPTPASTPTRSASGAAPTRSTSTCRASPSRDPGRRRHDPHVHRRRLRRAHHPGVGLGTIAREWGRIGCIGFGGPPAHIALLRGLCVEREGWLSH